MAPGPDLAGVVQQPLPDVLPDCRGTVETDGVSLLDLYGPAAAPAGYPQQVARNVDKPLGLN
jgi:hypothetical protein